MNTGPSWSPVLGGLEVNATVHCSRRSRAREARRRIPSAAALDVIDDEGHPRGGPVGTGDEVLAHAPERVPAPAVTTARSLLAAHPHGPVVCRLLSGGQTYGFVVIKKPASKGCGYVIGIPGDLCGERVGAKRLDLPFVGALIHWIAARALQVLRRRETLKFRRPHAATIAPLVDQVAKRGRCARNQDGLRLARG